jgi:hypothetical protein
MILRQNKACPNYSTLENNANSKILIVFSYINETNNPILGSVLERF